MTQPEYIAALLSIIVGLGLTDLARSLRELIRPRRKVNWHWLPLLWATNTFLLAIQIWWSSFTLLIEATSTFFFPFVIAFLFLYMSCAFSLPDRRWKDSRAEAGATRFSIETLSTQTPLDLRTFYFSEEHRRWFFGMLIGFVVTAQVGTQTARALAEDFAASETEMLLNAGAALLLGTLGLTDRWWVHAPLSVVLFLLLARTTIKIILGG